MVRSQKELINTSLQDITQAYTLLISAQNKLKEANLYPFASVFNSINAKIADQAHDLQKLNQ